MKFKNGDSIKCLKGCKIAEYNWYYMVKDFEYKIANTFTTKGGKSWEDKKYYTIVGSFIYSSSPVPTIVRTAQTVRDEIIEKNFELCEDDSKEEEDKMVKFKVGDRVYVEKTFISAGGGFSTQKGNTYEVGYRTGVYTLEGDFGNGTTEIINFLSDEIEENCSLVLKYKVGDELKARTSVFDVSGDFIILYKETYNITGYDKLRREYYLEGIMIDRRKAGGRAPQKAKLSIEVVDDPEMFELYEPPTAAEPETPAEPEPELTEGKMVTGGWTITLERLIDELILLSEKHPQCLKNGVSFWNTSVKDKQSYDPDEDVFKFETSMKIEKEFDIHGICKEGDHVAIICTNHSNDG